MLCKVEQDEQIIVKSISQAVDIINLNFGLNLKKDQFIGKKLLKLQVKVPNTNRGFIVLPSQIINYAAFFNSILIKPIFIL